MKEQGLNNLILLLNRNPTSQTLLNHYLTQKKQIANAKIKSIKERIFKEDAKYLMRGDQPTKAFFDKFKNRKKQNYISALKNEYGNRVTDIRDMLKIAEDYYKEIYSGQNSPIQQSAMDFFLNYITPNDACTDMFRDLMRVITLE